jgi:hypothetical protein
VRAVLEIKIREGGGSIRVALGRSIQTVLEKKIRRKSVETIKKCTKGSRIRPDVEGN